MSIFRGACVGQLINKRMTNARNTIHARLNYRNYAIVLINQPGPGLVDIEQCGGQRVPTLLPRYRVLGSGGPQCFIKHDSSDVYKDLGTYSRNELLMRSFRE